MINTLKALAAAALAGGFAFGANAELVRKIVIVHGAFADGSGWRGVYGELTGRSYVVSIVQNPLTPFADDVAARQRVLNRQDGAIAPDLLRSTARRIGAETTEVPGSHVVFLTQPKAVADVIEAAGRSAAEAVQGTDAKAACSIGVT